MTELPGEVGDPGRKDTPNQRNWMSLMHGGSVVKRIAQSAAVGVVAMSLAACATTGFQSTWKAPDAKPLGSLAGKKVLAVVLVQNESARRAAEDALASELTRRGAQGVASYTMFPSKPDNEAAARAAVEKAGFVAAVTMRPTGKDKEVYSTPSMYMGPSYGGYWGGYWGYGWGGAWSAPEIRTDTIVSVETLVYSLEQNKLVWAGQSRTTNPSKVDAFVREVVGEVGKEMKKGGLL